MLYYYWYFKLDLPFYVFAIIFLNKTNGQSSKKKSTMTNISIWMEYERRLHMEYFWNKRRISTFDIVK
jgi:hypothetical protein